MVDVRFQFSIKSSLRQQLFNALSRAVGRKMRNNFADVRPVVQDAIDETVENNQGRFIPTPSEIAELGIGQGGSPDSRSQTAWITLQPSSRRGVTSFSVNRRGAEGSSIIGEIKITIDPEAFYAQPDSIIETPDSDEIDQIPWMMWLIEGQTIQGSRFSGRVPDNSISRTGRGIMIDGGLWSIRGRGREIFSRLLEQSRLSVNRKLRSNEGVSILRRLR